ncbi:MAG: hypothetical protein CL677_03585 [Bdellovibrionaceae bacterium]|nr:hypothetical protein [Pseudobdellovibrionaceae bacterium]|tara:strand:- start:20640 stop:21605 length:966 start_codon:yes stop_codon:yes gene_type:complete
MEKFSHIISSEDQEKDSIVYTYEPKIFPIQITKSSNDFLRSQQLKSSDFKISDLVAEQTGIAEKQRQKIESEVEAQTLEKLKDIQEKAYQEAYELGLIEGTEKAFKENQQALARKVEDIDVIIGTMQDLVTQVHAESEAEIMRLIHAIASKIAMFEIKSSPEALVEIIEQLFLELKSDQRVVIKLSEDDALFIGTLREKNDQSVEFMKNVKIEVDEELDNGGCILESNFGAIDASIPQRVERVWSAIEERLPRINEHRVEAALAEETASEVVPFVEPGSHEETVEQLQATIDEINSRLESSEDGKDEDGESDDADKKVGNE